jgi:F-type H+-transporting ATPase subunit b
MIDWFTVAAQILNFLLLIFLLRRFLYRPILKAIAGREERIANTVREAEQAKADAQEQIEIYQHKNEEWEKEREAMVLDIRQEIEELRKELAAKAHHEVELAHVQWRRALQQEKQAFLHRLRQQVSEQTYKVAQHVLADLADADLEQLIIKVFMKRLEVMDNQDLADLKGSLTSVNGKLLVRSAFILSPENRLPIQDIISRKLVEAHQLEFETSPDLLYGIELRSNGYKLSWNVADYLQTLEEAINEQISWPSPEPSETVEE